MIFVKLDDAAAPAGLRHQVSLTRSYSGTIISKLIRLNARSSLEYRSNLITIVAFNIPQVIDTIWVYYCRNLHCYLHWCFARQLTIKSRILFTFCVEIFTQHSKIKKSDIFHLNNTSARKSRGSIIE